MPRGEPRDRTEKQKNDKRPCNKKKELIGEYRTALEHYARAISELARQVDVVPANEFEQLRRQAEIGRLAAEHAWVYVQRHVREHQC